MTSFRNSGAVRWSSLLLSVGLLIASFGFVDGRELLSQLSGVDMRWLMVAFFLSIIQLVLLGARWSLVSRRLGVPLSWRRASTEYALSLLANQVLPTGVAGEGLRALRHRRRAEGHGILRVVEVLALDRASGQLALWLLVMLSAPLTVQAGVARWQPVAVGMGAVILVASLLALIATRIPWARRRSEAILHVARRAIGLMLSPRQAAPHLSLSLALVFVALAQLWVAARALGVTLDTSLLLWLGPLIMVAASLPSFLGGWGVRESASALLFQAAGLGSSTGVAVSMVYGAFALLCSLPGVIVLLFDAERRPESPLQHWANGHALSMLVGTVLSVGLGYPPLLAFVACLSLLILVAQARGRWTPSMRFGLPNWITSARLVMSLTLLISYSRYSAPVLAAVVLACLILDGVDGWLARKGGFASEFGARFDIEVDAVLVMAVCVLLHARGIAGLWVLGAGLWRYVYVFAPVVLPAPEGEIPRSRYGRSVYVLMISSFVLALVVPKGVGALLAALGTIAVSASFLYTFWQRYQPRHTAPAE